MTRSGLVKVFVFDETQQPLSENIFRFFTFLRRKARWITAEELSREGVHKAVDFFARRSESCAARGNTMKILFAMDLIGGCCVRLCAGISSG